MNFFDSSPKIAGDTSRVVGPAGVMEGDACGGGAYLHDAKLGVPANPCTVNLRLDTEIPIRRPVDNALVSYVLRVR
jgi:hypothetical protein